MQITVDDILQIPFMKRDKEEKIEILLGEKPKPNLNITVVAIKSENGGGSMKTHQFNPTMYDDFKCLTGCEKRNAFFCWPCLLFKSSSNEWNSAGITDIGYLFENLSFHTESADHIQAILQFQKSRREENLISNLDFEEHNELVRRNREILKRLIDAVCNLLIEEAHFDKRKNGCQIYPQNVLKSLLFLKKFDMFNFNYIEDAMDLIKISPNIVNDLVDTIAKMVKLAVRKEVLASTYVSLILSDHSKISSKAQISTVLRYMKDGKAHERFIGFLNMGDKKNFQQIHLHINNTLCEFGIVDKLLAISFDGGILPAIALNVSGNEQNQNSPQPQADNIIEAIYPNAYFVPWYSHGLDYVLQQSLTNIKECSKFLKAMTEMKNFFHKRSNRYKSLETFVIARLPFLKNAKWFVRSQFIQTVHKYKKYFTLFFESISQNASIWGSDDVHKGLGFQQILREFQTVFLLHAFTKLFSLLTPLNKSVKSALLDYSVSSAATGVINSLCLERDKGFQNLWSEVHSGEKCVELPGPAPKKIKLDLDDPKIPEYRQLYNSIILCIMKEIELRYVKLSKLSPCQLLSCDKHGNYMFSHESLKKLAELRNGSFDEDLIRSELIVMRTNGKIFSQKSVNKLYEYLSEKKLKSSFKGIFKLCEFTLALPFKPPSKAYDNSKFEEIKDWSYVSNALGIQSGDACIPCIEIDYLQELKNSRDFHKDVVEIFYEVNKTIELIPK